MFGLTQSIDFNDFMLRKLGLLFPGTTSVLFATGGLAEFENGFNFFEYFSKFSPAAPKFFRMYSNYRPTTFW